VLAVASSPARAQPAPENGSVEITVVGTTLDLQRVRGLFGPRTLGGSVPRWARVDHFDPADILGPGHAAGAAVRCWLDLSDPWRARLYFASRSGERFLIRELELSARLGELDRQSLAQVMELSIAALLENEQAGLTREQTRALLADQAQKQAAAQPPPPPTPPPPAPVVTAAPPPPAPTGPAFGASAFYAVQVPAAGRFAHGPGLAVSLQRGDGARPLSAWLSGQYQLPYDVNGDRIGARFDALAFRAGLQLLRDLRGPRLRGGVRLGAGADVVHVAPQPGTVDTTATLMPSHWTPTAVVTGAVRLTVALRWRMRLAIDLLADVLPTVVHYDLAVEGVPSTVFSPWRVRPGVLLDLAVP